MMNDTIKGMLDRFDELSLYTGDTRFMLYALIDTLSKKGVIDWEEYNNIRAHEHIVVKGDSNNETIHE